ncbi:MAG: hypothetical protein IJC48_08715 [Clostridia bacterium]|nr:hypothetical protein [Clostridia bacterium]
MIQCLAVIVPIAAAIVIKLTGNYVFSYLLTFSCLLISALFRVRGWGFLVLAFAFSIFGDYMMAHRPNDGNGFLGGIAGFFVAHAFFLAFFALRYQFSPGSLAFGAILLIGYTILMIQGFYPNIDSKILKAAIFGYMVISIAVLTLSLSSGFPLFSKIVFSAGIALILFSDSMIALKQFMNVTSVGALILPTYYACHIMTALGVLLAKSGY